MKKQREVKSKFDEAERKLRAAEAEVAKDLGFELCTCDFPPAIMTKKRNESKWTCPRCGDEYERQVSGRIVRG